MLREKAALLAATYDWAYILLRQPSNVWQYMLALRQHPRVRNIADVDLMFCVAISGAIKPTNRISLDSSTRRRVTRYGSCYMIVIAGEEYRLPLHYCFFDGNFNAAIQGRSREIVELRDSNGRLIDDSNIAPKAGSVYYGLLKKKKRTAQS